MIGYVDTMLRYYLHIDPSQLTDEEWVQTLAHLKEIRKKEAKTTIF